MHYKKEIQTIITERGDTYDIDSGEVVEIKQHKPKGPGDKWYYDIEYGNGDGKRLFDVVEVYFNHHD